MPADLQLACRLAKASDVTYYVDRSGGAASCPYYADIGFTEPPDVFTSNVINAALVGVTNDAIILAFRGTLPPQTDSWDDFWDAMLDWMNDADAKPVSVPYSKGQVHQGFADSLESLWSRIMPSLQRLLSSNLPLYVTGHSKGGALASLAALRLLTSEHITPTEVYTFASPRAGDEDFALDYNSLISSDWRYENTDDIVPHLPPTLAVLGLLRQVEPRFQNVSAYDYRSVGNLQFINWRGEIVGDSLLLDGDRLIHFLELLAVDEIKQIIEDHSIEQQYIPKLIAKL